MYFLRSLKTILTLCSLAAAAEYAYDAELEVDVLFPRNETYNNLTSFPVVLAIQDVKAAYRFEWDIKWKLYSAAPGARESDYQSGYSSASMINTFQWYFDDVAVVPMLGYNFTQMKPGPYRLEWDYRTTPCTRDRPNTITYNILTTVASGSQYFSVVEDGSGLDFDIPRDDCPLVGDIWTVKESTSTYCPFLGKNSTSDGEPCDATLQSEEQVKCIKEYLFEGTFEAPNNETETCKSAFKRADPAWLEPMDGDRDDDDDIDTDTDTDTDDNDDDTDSSEDASPDDEDAAVSIRPTLFHLAAVAIAIAVL